MPGPTGSLRGMVLRLAPEQDAMYILLMSGQVLGYPVRRRYAQGDGLRISKPPLPVPGTWGTISLVNGDMRNALWEGALHPNLVDSIPNTPEDAYSDYTSEYNGGWSYTNGMSGNYARQWSDNSSLIVGPTSGMPTVYRHIVTSGQAQERVPFSQADRNPQPQTPHGVWYNQTASGQMGGFAFGLDVSGNVSLTQMATGKSFTVTYGTCTFTIDAGGNIDARMNGKIFNVIGDLRVTGAVIAGFGTGDQVGVQTHTHAQDPDSDGDTEHETHMPTAGS